VDSASAASRARRAVAVWASERAASRLLRACEKEEAERVDGRMMWGRHREIRWRGARGGGGGLGVGQGRVEAVTGLSVKGDGGKGRRENDTGQAEGR
jgi:hypothetical protein